MDAGYRARNMGGWGPAGLRSAAFTATSDVFHAGQWLANVLLFGVYQVESFELLVVLRSAVVTSVFVVLYVGCRRLGARPVIAGVRTLLAFPIVNLGLSLRPQLLALLPFVLYLEATRHPQSWGRLTLVLAAVMVFWTNVHGSFVFGLILVALALLGRVLDLTLRGERRHALADRDVRTLAALLVASALAALVVNPHHQSGGGGSTLPDSRRRIGLDSEPPLVAGRRTDVAS